MIVEAQYICQDQGMTTTPSADTEVAEFAGQLFFRLWRASHTRIAEALESIDLTPALFGVLNLLGAREGAIQQEIGSAMGIDPSTMVALIDQLEKAGLAKRRPHPKDRRAREVLITPKGRRTLERGRGLAGEVEDEVLRGLTAPERRQLLTLLRRALSTAPSQPLWRAEEGD
jgi:DNA-binding MarR family transcriptional regulator